MNRLIRFLRGLFQALLAFVPRPPALPPRATVWLLLLLTPVLVCGSLQAATHSSYPLIVNDALGRKVRIAAVPKRIISLSPSNTECLFTLGAGERVVGVTSFCDHPLAARGIVKIGGFAARTINIEAIVALKPDLVLAGDETQKPVIEVLAGFGITVVSVKVKGFEELEAQLLQLGTILDTRELAEKETRRIHEGVAKVTAKVAGIPAERRVRVYWEVFDEPLMSCGPRSIIGQLITLAGGENIFGDLKDEFPQVSAEAVIARDPALIMGPELMRARSLSLERLQARPGWNRIRAVKDARLYIFPDDIVARPGPRLVDGLTLIAQRLYPELFKEQAE